LLLSELQSPIHSAAATSVPNNNSTILNDGMDMVDTEVIDHNAVFFAVENNQIGAFSSCETTNGAASI